MITLGDIFRQYGPAYRAQFGERLLPSQYAAMQAIEQCRTEALGGPVYICPSCATSLTDTRRPSMTCCFDPRPQPCSN